MTKLVEKNTKKFVLKNDLFGKSFNSEHTNNSFPLPEQTVKVLYILAKKTYLNTFYMNEILKTYVYTTQFRMYNIKLWKVK